MILAEYRDVFLRNFQELESLGIASDIRITGSVATGNDACKSDIDFLVEDSPVIMAAKLSQGKLALLISNNFRQNMAW